MGIKANLGRIGSASFYDLFRVEYRIQDRATGADTEHLRIRNRIGLERPFGDRPYAPRSWYGLADIEALHRFDRDLSDLARPRLGAGYVLRPRTRVEFIDHAQFDRAGAGESFE